MFLSRIVCCDFMYRTKSRNDILSRTKSVTHHWFKKWINVKPFLNQGYLNLILYSNVCPHVASPMWVLVILHSETTQVDVRLMSSWCHKHPMNIHRRSATIVLLCRIIPLLVANRLSSPTILAPNFSPWSQEFLLVLEYLEKKHLFNIGQPAFSNFFKI